MRKEYISPYPLYKSLGQHFLINKDKILKIISCVDLKNTDILIEIGSGCGFLTEKLLEHQPKEAYLIEKDKRFEKQLKQITQRYSDKKYQVHICDARHFPYHKILNHNADIKIFSNLPYYISKYMLTFFLKPENIKWQSMVLMFQKEVADRIIAPCNTKKYGILSVMTQMSCYCKKILELTPQDFYPQPKVNSTLLQFSRIKNNHYPIKYNSQFTNTVQKIFSAKRKTISNVIKKKFNLSDKQAQCLLKKTKIKANLRAENIPVQSIIQLHHCILALKQHDNNEQSQCTVSS